MLLVVIVVVVEEEEEEVDLDLAQENLMSIGAIILLP
jgi:hypothetical protein